MVEALAYAAVDDEPPAAFFEAEFDGKHRVRIVLSYGQPDDSLVLRYESKRIEIADHIIGRDSAELTVSRVYGDYEVVRVNLWRAAWQRAE
jgi:hypothetical protein